MLNKISKMYLAFNCGFDSRLVEAFECKMFIKRSYEQKLVPIIAIS